MANSFENKNQILVNKTSESILNKGIDVSFNGAFIICIIAFLAITALFLLFKEGEKRGRKRASKKYDGDLEKLKLELKYAITKIENSNRRLQDTIGDANLTPKNHILVKLDEEGSSRHFLNDGYVMRIERKYEHRLVAEEILGRKLANHEEVHHIYAPAKSDNSPSNLCVLDREDHRFFHDMYLPRRLKVNHGRYPSAQEQKSILKRQLRGILLEEALAKKINQYPIIAMRSESEVFFPQNMEHL